MNADAASRPTPISAAMLGVARTLMIDQWTAEALMSLRSAGVRPILLKGPVIARWLYAENPSARLYDDTDLLVHPNERQAAEGVLGVLGYRPEPIRRAQMVHAHTYRRPADGAVVDLHTTVHGLERAHRPDVFAAAANDPDHIEVARALVETPGLAFRTLHLATHVNPFDREEAGRPWQDLALGVAKIDFAAWAAAAELARSFDAADTMREALELVPGGEDLADRLGLTRRRRSRLEAAIPAPYRAALHRLRNASGWRKQAAVLAQMVVPPTYQLRRASDVPDQMGFARAHGRRLVRLAKLARHTLGQLARPSNR